MAKKMTKELYEKLDMAGKTLCEYCENAECSCCQVNIALKKLSLFNIFWWQQYFRFLLRKNKAY